MARQGASVRGGRRSAGNTRPMVRRGHQARGLNVTEAAARSIRAGHPWVFRDSVRRAIEGLEPGAAVRVLDLDAHPLGWGIVEPQGAIAVRLRSRDPDFAWGDEAVAARVDAALELRQRLRG